jgi:hypothetical protein
VRIYKFIFILFFLFGFSGCSTIAERAGYIEKAKLEQTIAQLTQEREVALNNKESEIKAELNRVISSKDSQLQSASNSLYATSLVKPYFKDETRPLVILFNRIDEAKAALGVGPTIEAMRAEQERLVRELDETLTSMEELKGAHDAKVKENESLVAQTLEKEAAVKRLEEEKEVIERAANEEIQKIQGELNDKNNELIAKERENSKITQYIEANKRLIMSVCGLVALGSLAGAIFSPLFKKELGIFAGVTGAIAISVPFVQPLHIGIVFALVLIYVFVKIERKGAVSLKTNENLINAIQSIKENKPDLYDAEIKPELTEWNKTYRGDEKIEDKVVTKHIDDILRDYERK